MSLPGDLLFTPGDDIESTEVGSSFVSNTNTESQGLAESGETVRVGDERESLPNKQTWLGAAARVRLHRPVSLLQTQFSPHGKGPSTIFHKKLRQRGVETRKAETRAGKATESTTIASGGGATSRTYGLLELPKDMEMEGSANMENQAAVSQPTNAKIRPRDYPNLWFMATTWSGSWINLTTRRRKRI